jgi:hypothetical protein
MCAAAEDMRLWLAGCYRMESMGLVQSEITETR